jgi:carboxyl-terminal processing protease
MDGTPAFKAGIKAGDYITAVDGASVLGMTVSEAVKQMRGKPGEPVVLSIAREKSEPFDVTIVREVIEPKSAVARMEGDYGFLRVSAFNERTTDEAERVFTELRAANPQMKGLILDLRNNPGGLLDQAVGLSDLFLEGGEIVSQRGRNARDVERYNARPGDIAEGLPIVVLINTGSASAAEIVAGALQDQGRATLVGTRSFGKGSVQSIIPLGFDGAMRLTTARYYTPNNRSIQALGITPDIEVLQDVPEEFQGRDLLIGEAGLAGHISGEAEEEATVGSSVYVPAERSEDNQLQYAIDLILGEAEDPAFPPNPDAVIAQQEPNDAAVTESQ